MRGSWLPLKTVRETESVGFYIQSLVVIGNLFLQILSLKKWVVEFTLQCKELQRCNAIEITPWHRCFPVN